MPRYLILDETQLRQAVLSEQNVGDPRSAIEAVPNTTALPERVLVVKRSDINVVQVVDADTASVDLVVERPAGA